MEVKTAETPRLLTVKKAAKELGISRCTAYRWIRRKWLLCIRLPNGSLRIPTASIDAILARR